MDGEVDDFRNFCDTSGIAKNVQYMVLIVTKLIMHTS